MRRAEVRLFRVAFALMAIGLIALPGASSAEAADNPVSITLKVGYSGFVKPQQWMPVSVDMTNKGPDIDGILEVYAPPAANGPPTGSAIYGAHVSLPSGTTKHLKTYLVEGWAPTPVSVRILQNGKVVASATSAAGANPTSLVGVLSDAPAALNNFEAQHPGGVRANVVHLSLDDVGDSAILLRAFDLLVIDDFATDTLTAAQRGAITDYVQNGGALLLGTGASWRKTLAGISATILPIRIGGTATLRAIGAQDSVSEKLSTVEVATGALDPDAQAWWSEGKTPLLAEKVVGSGSVNLATFDWNQEPVASWSGTSSVLRQVLVRTLFSSAMPPGMALGKGGMTGGAVTVRSTSLSQALGSLPALDLPSLMVIGILILAYVLIVGPINYLALRTLRRRALAWITVPLIAVVASAGAFGTGMFTKGRSVQTNQVSIIHLQAGWDRAYEESYTGVVTPTRGDFEVKVAGSRTLIGPIVSFSSAYSSNGGQASTTELIRINSDNNSIGLPGMTAYILRGFATEGFIDAPHLVVTTKFVNGNLTGSVRNDSSTTFTDAVVIAGDGFQKLPGLAPGASISFDFTPKIANPYAGPPAFSTIYTNYLYGPPPGQPTDADREAAEKTSILSLIAAPNYYGYTAAVAPMVVAWTKQPAERIAVTGSLARSTSETAVVVPMAIGQIGPGPLSAGLVVSRFTDIDGTAQSGQPGGVLMQNGTVTYAFKPMLAPGRHLTAAGLDSTNQIAKGGPPAAPGSSGSAPTLQAEVWDWANSAWVSMAYNANGTSILPPIAVDPASSEVRLRLTATGGQTFLGSISLTGTVA
jgi:hypothetical protein